MADFLLEILSEEIPARMQSAAAQNLKRMVTTAFDDAGLNYGEVKVFADLRRLVINIEDIPEQQPDLNEVKKGPRTNAPEQAIAGFVRSAGINNISEAKVASDKKGEYYYVEINQAGLATPELIKTIVPNLINRFPWPKSMRWGDGDLRWVRPLRSILCLFAGKPVEFMVGDIKSSNLTYGHRFMQPEAIEVNSFTQYQTALHDAKVMVDAVERRKEILSQSHHLAIEHQLAVTEDLELLNEVAGIVEWPVVMLGEFAEDFLELPPEVITISIKTHQKCFALHDPVKNEIANKYILVANLIAKDGGKAIVAGNNRVVAARLSDAKFFWEQDIKTPLSERLPQFANIVFHEKIGTQKKRIERLVTMAEKIAPAVGADIAEAKQAALLAKLDLVTEMVGEFPELQGVIGHYYARKQGENENVVAAIAEHYQPQGPFDKVPQNPCSIAVALADKIDMLQSFWQINEKPSGSKDPYALRRAALGVIRIIIDNKLQLPILPLLTELDEEKRLDLLQFFIERLKVYLKDKGLRYDYIDAVLSQDKQDDIAKLAEKAKVMAEFLTDAEDSDLLAGIKRAYNILKAEEKKDGVAYEGAVEDKFLAIAQEKELYSALKNMREAVNSAMAENNFSLALQSLAKLREPVDAFFAKVIVNDSNPIVRRNRLCLLHMLRAAAGSIADFSKIEG